MPTATAAAAVHATPCKARNLRLRGGRQGGGFGTAHVDLLITNGGIRPCKLTGPPSIVTIALAAGGQLPVAYRRSHDVGDPQVVLKPDARTSLTLSWQSWCGAALGPLQVSMVLPHGTGEVSGPFDGPPDYNLVPDCADRHSVLELLSAYE